MTSRGVQEDQLSLAHTFSTWKLQLECSGCHGRPGDLEWVTLIYCPCFPLAPPAVWAGDWEDEADASEGPRGQGGGAGGCPSVLPEAGMWAGSTAVPLGLETSNPDMPYSLEWGEGLGSGGWLFSVTLWDTSAKTHIPNVFLELSRSL